jgi:hypothetical protein
MNVAHTVAEVLREHVTLEYESIDRMYLNVYVPQLQNVGGVVGYLHAQHQQRFASTVAVAPMTAAFVAAIERFYPWIVASTAMVNHFYFYPDAGERSGSERLQHRPRLLGEHCQQHPGGPMWLPITTLPVPKSAQADSERRRKLGLRHTQPRANRFHVERFNAPDARTRRLAGCVINGLDEAGFDTCECLAHGYLDAAASRLTSPANSFRSVFERLARSLFPKMVGK